MFKILFICTDNICRSVAAEYLLRDYLSKNHRADIEVASAGTEATSDVSSFCMAHVDRLRELGIDISDHRRTQLTGAVLDACDLAVVMDENQQEWIRAKFDVELSLYNEIYKQEKTSVLINPPGAKGTIAERLETMVDYLAASLPEVVAKVTGEDH